jgi:hypothetical protein
MIKAAGLPEQRVKNPTNPSKIVRTGYFCGNELCMRDRIPFVTKSLYFSLQSAN